MADPTDEEIEAISRGHQAAHELRETERAFADVRQGLFEVIAKSALGEAELREKCFLAVQSLDAVKKLLIEVATGKDVADYNALIRGVMAGEDSD